MTVPQDDVPTVVCVGGVRPSPLVQGMEWAPFPKIPNVKTFTVKTGMLDELFLSFGIKKRTSSKYEFSYYQNQAALRYAAFTITKMRNTKSRSLY